MRFYERVKIQKNNRGCFAERHTTNTFNITVIKVYAPASNAEEAELEQFYEDLQDLLELTLKRDVLLHYGGLECKSTGHELPGITDKFGHGVQNEAGQKPIEFCQENTLVIANLFQQRKRRLYKWTLPDEC